MIRGERKPGALPFDRLAEAVRACARRAGAERAWVFGSYARGSATARSDVDLLVEERTDARFLDRIDKYLLPLQEELHVAVEVLVYTPEELQACAWKPFLHRALKEGVLVYERGKAA